MYSGLESICYFCIKLGVKNWNIALKLVGKDPLFSIVNIPEKLSVVKMEFSNSDPIFAHVKPKLSYALYATVCFNRFTGQL